jgi:aminoglycoside 3-N-acetyltransferase
VPLGTSAPYTLEDLAAGLERLGLAKGDSVLLRAATRPIGATAGRAAELLRDAALRVVGPDGTLLGLSFSQQTFRFRRRTSPVFRADSATDTGGFAAAMLAYPGAVRSQHPTNSFVGIGAMARDLLAGHDAQATCFAPMRRLMEAGGKMVLVGCGSSSPGFSTVHLVQEELGLATQSFFRDLFGSWYEVDGSVRWFSRHDVPGCSRGFGKFYSHYTAAEKLRTGRVGDAESMLIGCNDAFDVEYALLNNDPRFALCDRRGCLSCRATRMYNMRDIPGFILRKALGLARDE